MVSLGRLGLLCFQSGLSRSRTTAAKTLGFSIAAISGICGSSVVHSTASCRTTFCMAASSESGKMEESLETGYLDAKRAYDLDQHLFNNGYTLEQLMELAGLAVAEAVYECVEGPKKNILIVSGPGNNGGDGLVAGRHLALFGHEVTILYPKRSAREEHYAKLIIQCEGVGVKFIDEIQNDTNYDAVVDAIFGFSFKGKPREPFLQILKDMTRMQKEQSTKIISVDVPSGWNVDEGVDENTETFYPDVLISLTAPKLCAKQFKGRHFIGGRFLPDHVAKKFGVRMPNYQGSNQIIEISTKLKEKEDLTKVNEKEDECYEGWEAQYHAYLIEKERELAAKDELEVKNQQTQVDAMEGVEDWAIQYHNYCVEKERELAAKDEIEASKRADSL